MSIFRRKRLSDSELREVMQSLPSVKAPADFESQLDRMIAMHSEHVPHMLGSMPMVPAPDDFDSRLMEAIRDRRRPVAPIPAAIAGSGASISWLNNMMGWIGGSLAVVVLAFVVNVTGDAPKSAAVVPAPAAATGTGGAANMLRSTGTEIATRKPETAGTGSVGAPSGVTFTERMTIASAQNPAAQAEPGSARHAAESAQTPAPQNLTAPAQLHPHVNATGGVTHAHSAIIAQPPSVVPPLPVGSGGMMRADSDLQPSATDVKSAETHTVASPNAPADSTQHVNVVSGGGAPQNGGNVDTGGHRNSDEPKEDE
ncbi:MAG: hypothetical protein JST22_19690 [Bacteroidetes bacterium]|nr:hypothetical protein [Bacteroidota bacterium]